MRHVLHLMKPARPEGWRDPLLLDDIALDSAPFLPAFGRASM